MGTGHPSLNMKGHNGEGVKQSQVKGALGAGEREPLFPRLHVNETEKTGPKAPPRNKMALYEQFTVPSHRFEQPSQTSATTLYQQQYGSHELGYPYLPYYMPSVPYAKTNHAVQVYAQPSHGTSSSCVTNGSGVVNKESSQKFHRHHKMGKSSPCKVSSGLIEATADCVARGSSELKGKDANAPAESSFTNLVEESSNSVHDVSPDMERRSIMDITESFQEALSTVEAGMERRVPDDQNCVRPRFKCLADRERSTFMTDGGQLQQAAQYSVNETLTTQTKEGASIKSRREACLQTGSSRVECKHDPVIEGLTSHAHCTMQSTSTGDETSRIRGPKDALENSFTDVETVDDSLSLSATALAEPSVKSLEELNIISKRNSEVSQRSECRILNGCHSDDLVVPSTSVASMSVIKPKDVIHAIGQQQFWKARKALLRQQRIFSDQVFELHKLIKVQQLLAETPGTLIDGETHFETREECNAAAPSAKRAINSHNVGFDFKEVSKGMSLEVGGQPKNKGEHTQTVSRDGIGSSKLMSGFSSGGVSAWGYPNLGQWVGPMAAQGWPFGFRPFVGTLPPGSAFGLPDGSVLQGSVSPMISFGIPFCDQRQGLPAEMGSNYGPPTVFKHEGSGTASGNSGHVSNNLGGSWYNNLNYQRMHAAQDVPTGSGASVNKSPATVQGVKTSCIPGLSYQWGLTNQSGPSNTDDLESHAHWSEISSHSVANRLTGHKFPSTSPMSAPKKLGFCHQDVEGLAQTSDLPSACGSVSSDQYDNSKGSGEEKKLDAKILRHQKGPKDGVCLSGQLSDANEHSSDLYQSALELFPLVPSLVSSGWNGLKTTEGVPGRVIRAVPRRAIAASESAAGILLSLQRERQK